MVEMVLRVQDLASGLAEFTASIGPLIVLEGF